MLTPAASCKHLPLPLALRLARSGHRLLNTEPKRYGSPEEDARGGMQHA